MNFGYSLALIAILSTPASAHDWFDRDCCSDRDCRIADPGEVVVRRDGVHVQTKDGVSTVLSITSPKVRPTLDRENRPAVCLMKPVVPATPPLLTCVYIQTGGT